MHAHRYLFLLVATLMVFSAFAHGAITAEPKKRHFLFTYKVKLEDVPHGEMRLWIPVAPSNGEQTVRIRSVRI